MNKEGGNPLREDPQTNANSTESILHLQESASAQAEHARCKPAIRARKETVSTSTRWHHAFTLVELFVVIGTIAVLLAVLLSALQTARRHAERIKCLSNMRQIGAATFQYGVDNRGFWPPQQHGWTIGGLSRARRWHDFLGRYIVGGVGVTVAGVIRTGDINAEGTQDRALEPQIWSDEIRYGTNALWGCPSWERATYIGPVLILNGTLNPGYGWNRYALAPLDLNAAGGLILDRQTVVTGPPIYAGIYARATQYKAPSSRALLVESVTGTVNLTLTPGAPWRFRPDGTIPFPARPDGATFSIDFNRHGKRRLGNGPLDLSLNILFCDGHARPASARQAWQAIRFN